MGWVSNIDHTWLEPSFARFLDGLAAFSRLIIFDKRGTGLSDRVSADEFPDLEQRMDDVRAVMDAAGSEKAALVGVSEAGPMCALFAATYPERTQALVVIGGFARDDSLHNLIPEEHADLLHRLGQYCGRPVAIDSLRARAPSRFDDQGFRQWWDSYLRAAASAGAAVAHARMSYEIDVRAILPAIRVPSLVIHAVGDQAVHVDSGRYLAQHIPGARYVELDSRDHLPWVSDTEPILGEIEELLTGGRAHREPDRVLATVLYTDIVSSTEQLASVGDRRWHALLEAHHSVVRKELARFCGREVKTTGDGFLATFDGPARAIRCARAIQDAVLPLGLQVRAGLHTGECEIIGDDIAGIAVHTGARVAALAAGGEVLVSSTVKDLVAGSGIDFADRGTHVLKGVPGEWRIFAVTAV